MESNAVPALTFPHPKLTSIEGVVPLSLKGFQVNGTAGMADRDHTLFEFRQCVDAMAAEPAREVQKGLLAKS